MRKGLFMAERRNTNIILSRTRRNQIYLPYARKQKYFDAIVKGDTEAIAELSQQNYEYPTAFSHIPPTEAYKPKLLPDGGNSK